MATTQIPYTVDGTTVSTKTFPYGTISTFVGTSINDSDVIEVYHEGTLLTLTTHYTVDPVLEQITIVPSYTLVIGDSVVVERNTTIENPFVDYSNNTIIDASELDLSNLQSIYKLQEFENALDNTLQYNIASSCWDGLGRTTCNFAAATTSTGLTTLAQVQNLVAGAETADIDNIQRWEFTGDGTTTAFTLTDAASGLTDSDQLLVFVDGVQQRKDNVSLTVGPPKKINFTTAPVPNARIAVLTVVGIVSTIFAADTINGDAIVDDAIGVDKLNFGAGDDKRALILNTSGDPTARVLVHTDISDFDTGVRTNTLNQMAAPTTDLAIGQKLTSVTSGSASTDGVNKGQVDAAIAAAVAAIPSSSTTAGTALLASPSGVISVDAGGSVRMLTVCVDVDGTKEYFTISKDDISGYGDLGSGGSVITLADTGSGVTFTRSGGGSGQVINIEYAIITDS